MYLSFLSCLLLGDGTLAQTGACPVLWRESRAVVDRVGKKIPLGELRELLHTQILKIRKSECPWNTWNSHGPFFVVIAMHIPGTILQSCCRVPGPYRWLNIQ